MSNAEEKKYFDEILEGKLPSVIFNNILFENAGMDKYFLAVLFITELDLLDSSVIHVIWNWKSSKSIRGKDDDWLNSLIISEMKDAGYIFE